MKNEPGDPELPRSITDLDNAGLDICPYCRSDDVDIDFCNDCGAIWTGEDE